MGMDAHVTLVIPGRNCARTLATCLDAVTAMLKTTPLAEVIFVDDASTDDSAAIARQKKVRVLTSGMKGQAGGPGAARNIGWNAADSPLIWFIDADCVPNSNALPLLLAHLTDPRVGAVGGSYGNMETNSLLACLIHEEIVARHCRMPPRVTFLGSFNVLYRRDVLAQVGGFDERFLKAQDAELSWRVIDAGHELAFEPRSRVAHFHPIRWMAYLRTQRQQGYWRMQLYRQHAKRAGGDSYSGLIDHVQPPLSVMMLALTPLLLFDRWRGVPLLLLGLLLVLQFPMTLRLIRQTGSLKYLAYISMGAIRAVWRGIGMVQGICAVMMRSRAEDSRP